MAETSSQNFDVLFEDALGFASGRGEPDWLLAARQGAFDRFRGSGFPTTRSENWKYTSLRPVEDAAYELPVPSASQLPASSLPQPREDELLIVFINGVLSIEQSAFGTHEGVKIQPLFDALGNGEGDGLRSLLTRIPENADDVFSNLNMAFLSNGVFIRISAEARVPRRIHILSMLTVGDRRIFSAPRVVVHAETNSEATIVQSTIGPPLAPGLTCIATDITVEDGARLFYGKIQSEGSEAFHFSHMRTVQGRDTDLTLFDFSMGARLARNDVMARIEGEGSEVSMNGVYAVRQNQHLDNHTAVDHAVPRCISRQTYKGILSDRARAVFDGRIIVREGACLTDALQMNKNLLLSKTARVDTKPQLEISNDDVKCTHGATIGQLEEDELFYLQSRGIGPDNAVAMLSRGFVEDVIFTIKDDVVRESLRDVLSTYFQKPVNDS